VLYVAGETVTGIRRSSMHQLTGADYSSAGTSDM
jgi:hypothetical protein